MTDFDLLDPLPPLPPPELPRQWRVAAAGAEGCGLDASDARPGGCVPKIIAVLVRGGS